MKLRPPLNHSSYLLLLGFLALSTIAPVGGCSGPDEIPEEEYFEYDEASATVEASMFENSELYDADVISSTDGLWLTWLEFVPGQGDHLWVGKRRDGEWVLREKVSSNPGYYAHPTLTIDQQQQLWLTYEHQPSENALWDIVVRRRIGEGTYSDPLMLGETNRNDINHDVALAPDGSLWVGWQGDRAGQFDILAAKLRLSQNKITTGEIQSVSSARQGDWHPSLTVTPDNHVIFVWDTYDGESFNIRTRRKVGQTWRPAAYVAKGEAFQGRADVLADSTGRTWVLWEEGSPNWGEPYRILTESQRATDRNGPLHSWRALHVGVLDQNDALHKLDNPLPMPSMRKAAKRMNLREGVRKLGTYYERGKLTLDNEGRVWVSYRHFYQPQVGYTESIEHHIEQGWRIYARAVEEDGWSSLYATDVHQRDGMQRLSVTGHNNGLALAYTTGRTDRDPDPAPRGVALAAFNHNGPVSSPDANIEPAHPAVTPSADRTSRSPQATAEANGTTYRLYYGDLHRHTDLSLCFPFFDGSIDDAYRYAIEVSKLDFLGITDHTRDIARGDALSQLWWRSTKEVRRHRLTNRFFPFFSYERSHRHTDHNVISLRDDMLRNYPPPLPEFWNELGDSTITIPHAPVRGRIWDYHNDTLRPLLEIYQGFRNRASHHHAHEGLSKGYHFGFIASSDHLSTGTSYAAVWAPDGSREAIFHAMKHRRTFGATDKMQLVFRTGEHLMGERVTRSSPPTFQIDVEGTAEIGAVDVYRDGERITTLNVPANRESVELEYTPDELLSTEHYYYVYVHQRDGNQAWSSPIWISPNNE